MSRPETVLVVGDVFVDYHVDERLVRLGGVFHAARALDALDTPYAVIYTSPDYLQKDIESVFSKLHARASIRAGRVSGSPAVMVINESREIGDQGYDEILRDAKALEWSLDGVRELVERQAITDAMVFPGRYPLVALLGLLADLKVKTHIDTQYEPGIMNLLREHGRGIETFFCSTSAPLFRVDAHSEPNEMRSLISPAVAKVLIIKENRGGSSAFVEMEAPIGAPSFPTKTVHSVGVGDCFDCAWIARSGSTPERLRRAAYYAALYAGTWEHEEFRRNIAAVVKIDNAVIALEGVRVPWHERREMHIYIAAPDFPKVDVRILDQLELSLRYHNFSPHRPVKEHGLWGPSTTPEIAAGMYAQDLDLLEKARLVIVVPLIPDPGTFVEMGIACARGLPVILLETTATTGNLFAERSATRICHSTGEVIDAVFALLAETR